MPDKFVLHHQLQKDCIEIAEFPLCKLLLCNDSNFPWFILVPRVDGVSDIYELDWAEQQQLLNESSMLSEFLMQEFKGDKMNVAALGNVVPQLHIHHIVRYSSDTCWPKPIWGQQPTKLYTDEEIRVLKVRIQPKLSTIILDNS